MMNSKKKIGAAVNPFRLAELRSIVGPNLDDDALIRLLNRANGVVERAVNFFFDSNVPSTSVQTCHNVDIQPCNDGSTNETRDENEVHVDRTPTYEPRTETIQKCISHVHGTKTSPSADGIISQGCWPKLFGTIQVVAYTTIDVRSGALSENCKIFVSRRSSTAEMDADIVASKRSKKAGFGQSRKAVKKDYILRWGVGSEECGRLPSEISKPLAILMDSGWVELDGSTLSSPDSLKKFANVPICLNIRLKEFSTSTKASDCDAETPDSPDESLIRLLNVLKYTPKVPCEIVSSELGLLGLDDEKAGSEVCKVESKCEAKVAAADEEGSLSREHIDILFAEAEQPHEMLPENQPPAMITKLRDYQLQVVTKPRDVIYLSKSICKTSICRDSPGFANEKFYEILRVRNEKDFTHCGQNIAFQMVLLST
jgi:hypothetical protein